MDALVAEPFVWTEDNLTQASSLWSEGTSAA